MSINAPTPHYALKNVLGRYALTPRPLIGKGRRQGVAATHANCRERASCTSINSQRRNENTPRIGRTERSRISGWNCVFVIRQKSGLMIGMKKKPVVVIDSEIMGGEPCFAGTRVPVRALLDYIEGGDTLDEFLEQYPTVSRKQAIGFLEQASDSLLATA